LAHCRLAIIDLSAAASQPIANGDASIQLTFNGEIYNFQELRKQLVADGYQFKSRSDSEVIVHGYAKWGDEIVTRLRGDFAFGLWDERRRRLLLARDRLGVKPLYYRLRGSELAFASEPRALLPLSNETLAPDLDALFSFLRIGYVQGSRSIWEGISRLPPATAMIVDVDRGTVSMRRYWTPTSDRVNRTLHDAAEEAGELLRASVREQLTSDIPIGVFLSGGIDSSLISSFATQAKSDLDSFFVDFAGWSGTERGDARIAADHVGTRHHVEEINLEALDLAEPEHAEAFFSAFDEPIADTSIVPTWHLARCVRKQVGVALSGDGGDELFGGYTWYQQVQGTPRRRLAWFAESIRRKIGMGREWPQGCADQLEYYHLLQFPGFTNSELATLFPQWSLAAQGLRAGLRIDLASECREDDLKYWQHLDLESFLVDCNLARVDRASMAHGLEVRVPLLDYRLVELALALPPELMTADHGGKAVLRELAASRLPRSLQMKPKQGFSFPLERVITPGAMKLKLLDGALVRCGIIDRTGLNAWLASGTQGLKLWMLFVLDNWARQWLLKEPAR
jgi:asparagine synthase (glutamine-hydrolysing)